MVTNKKKLIIIKINKDLFIIFLLILKILISYYLYLSVKLRIINKYI